MLHRCWELERMISMDQQCVILSSDSFACSVVPEKMQKARNNPMLKANEAYRQGSSQTSAQVSISWWGETREEFVTRWFLADRVRIQMHWQVSTCLLKLLHGFLPDSNQWLGSVADNIAYPLRSYHTGFNFLNPAGRKSKKSRLSLFLDANIRTTLQVLKGTDVWEVKSW